MRVLPSTKPSISDPGVHQVTPGQEVPLRVPGSLSLMKTNRSYYIPGKPVVFGNLSKDPEDVNDVQKIYIYGHRTLSGDTLLHHSDSDKLVEEFWNQFFFF